MMPERLDLMEPAGRTIGEEIGADHSCWSKATNNPRNTASNTMSSVSWPVVSLRSGPFWRTAAMVAFMEMTWPTGRLGAPVEPVPWPCETARVPPDRPSAPAAVRTEKASFDQHRKKAMYPIVQRLEGHELLIEIAARDRAIGTPDYPVASPVGSVLEPLQLQEG